MFLLEAEFICSKPPPPPQKKVKNIYVKQKELRSAFFGLMSTDNDFRIYVHCGD